MSTYEALSLLISIVTLILAIISNNDTKKIIASPDQGMRLFS